MYVSENNMHLINRENSFFKIFVIFSVQFYAIHSQGVMDFLGGNLLLCVLAWHGGMSGGGWVRSPVVGCRVRDIVPYVTIRPVWYMSRAVHDTIFGVAK